MKKKYKNKNKSRSKEQNQEQEQLKQQQLNEFKYQLGLCLLNDKKFWDNLKKTPEFAKNFAKTHKNLTKEADFAENASKFLNIPKEKIVESNEILNKKLESLTFSENTQGEQNDEKDLSGNNEFVPEN